MKLRYEPTLDLLRESVLLLQHFCGSEANITYLQLIKKKYPTLILTKEQTTLHEELQNFLDELRERLALTEAEKMLLRPDYGEEEYEDAAYSSVLVPFMTGYGLSLVEVIKTIRQVDEDKLRAFFLAITLDDDRFSRGEGVPLDCFIHQVVTQNGWNAENKCHLVDVFLNYHVAFESAVVIVERLLRLLEAGVHKIESIVEKWHLEMLPRIRMGENDKLFATLLQSIPAIDRQGLEITVRPGFAVSTGLMLTLTDNVEKEPLFPNVHGGLMMIGLAFLTMQEDIFSIDHLSEADMLSTLKVLSDKSKYDILRILRQKPCYGAQLAQKIGLSPATISHHMNALLSLRLVCFDAQENKLYYRLNPERIKSIVDTIGTALC